MKIKDKNKQESYGNTILLWISVIIFIFGLFAHDEYLIYGGGGLFLFMALAGDNS